MFEKCDKPDQGMKRINLKKLVEKADEKSAKEIILLLNQAKKKPLNYCVEGDLFYYNKLDSH